MEDTTPARLPGLSKLTEAELRAQYVKELGQDVPEDLTTTAQLREAISKHREEAAATADATPTTLAEADSDAGTARAGDPNDSAPKRDTGPSAAAQGPVVGVVSDAVPAGHRRVTHTKTGLRHDFPEATWNAMGNHSRAQYAAVADATPKPPML